jgi:hypothetical protein
MKYEIKNRCDNACVVWSGEIEDQGIDSKNLGAAVKKAVAEKASMLFADLRSANLRSANLRSANLRSADLRSADLRFADLRFANLRSANLHSADLRSADLLFADLHSANLRSANLHSADLRSADLRFADLLFANLLFADLRSADLRSADLDNDAKIARLDVCVWPVTIQDTGIEIGCKTYDHASIMGMTEERAAQEHPDAAIRWRRWGKVLQALVVATLGEVAEIGTKK